MTRLVKRLFEQLDVPDDGGQWALQLMCHCGHEAVFVVVELLELLDQDALAC